VDQERKTKNHFKKAAEFTAMEVENRNTTSTTKNAHFPKMQEVERWCCCNKKPDDVSLDLYLAIAYKHPAYIPLLSSAFIFLITTNPMSHSSKLSVQK